MKFCWYKPWTWFTKKATCLPGAPTEKLVTVAQKQRPDQARSLGPISLAEAIVLLNGTPEPVKTPAPPEPPVRKVDSVDQWLPRRGSPRPPTEVEKVYLSPTTLRKISAIDPDFTGVKPPPEIEEAYLPPSDSPASS